MGTEEQNRDPWSDAVSIADASEAAANETLASTLEPPAAVVGTPATRTGRKSSVVLVCRQCKRTTREKDCPISSSDHVD